MKIVIVGASGTIGSAVSELLAKDQVIRVGHSQGDARVDMRDPPPSGRCSSRWASSMPWWSPAAASPSMP
jgi:uncharacterized protein YbjT (DUF2867 family)